MIQDAIDSFNNCTESGARFVLCVEVVGIPGGGKSFVGQMSCLYVLSKGLKVIATSIMAHRSVHLGKSHIHCLSAMDVKDYLSPQRGSERSIINCKKDPVKENALQSLHVLFLDEAGQVSAELLSMMDMILRRIRGNDLPFR